MSEKKIYYYLGGIGSNVQQFARQYYKKHPDYVFIDFIGIMLNQQSYVDKSVIVSYPPYLNSEAYSLAKLEAGVKITQASIDRKNIIIYGSGVNFETNISYMRLQKEIGYQIIIRYVDTPIEKQLKNVKNISDDPNSRLFIPPGQVIDNNELLKVSLPGYRKVADKFQVIEI